MTARPKGQDTSLQKRGSSCPPLCSLLRANVLIHDTIPHTPATPPPECICGPSRLLASCLTEGRPALSEKRGRRAHPFTTNDYVASPRRLPVPSSLCFSMPCLHAYHLSGGQGLNNESPFWKYHHECPP